MVKGAHLLEESTKFLSAVELGRLEEFSEMLVLVEQNELENIDPAVVGLE